MLPPFCSGLAETDLEYLAEVSVLLDLRSGIAALTNSSVDSGEAKGEVVGFPVKCRRFITLYLLVLVPL